MSGLKKDLRDEQRFYFHFVVIFDCMWILTVRGDPVCVVFFSLFKI